MQCLLLSFATFIFEIGSLSQKLTDLTSWPESFKNLTLSVHLSRTRITDVYHRTWLFIGAQDSLGASCLPESHFTH